MRLMCVQYHVPKEEYENAIVEAHLPPIPTEVVALVAWTRLSLMKGLCVITKDILAAARQNKWKNEAESVASVVDVESVTKALGEAHDEVVKIRGKHAEMLRHH